LSEGWTLSFVALWILQVAVVVVVFGLARQVGLLHLRLRPVGPGAVEDGPPIGSHVESATFSSLLSRPVSLPHPNTELTLLVFASPRCSLCGPVLEGLKRLSAVESSFQCVPIVDDDGNLGLSYLVKYGFPDGLAANELTTISVQSRPFGLVLDREGEVLSSGITNTLEQLEELVFQAKHALRAEEDTVEEVTDQESESYLLNIAAVSAQRRGN
jgi:methylamine dehydrogenase accessory protein MauD